MTGKNSKSEEIHVYLEGGLLGLKITTGSNLYQKIGTRIFLTVKYFWSSKLWIRICIDLKF